MEILVTDVTEMSGSNYCVAGWDATNKRMVRPLPGGGHWPQALIAKHRIQPGTVLKAIAMGAATGAFPHLTEDTPIDLDHRFRETGLMHGIHLASEAL